MDPKAIALQLERNFTSVHMLLAQQQKKIEELEQLATYYKNRNICLEKDNLDLARELEVALSAPSNSSNTVQSNTLQSNTL
jgi:hypothetical protein